MISAICSSRYHFSCYLDLRFSVIAFRHIGKVLASSDAEAVAVVAGIFAGSIGKQIKHRRNLQVSSEMCITPGLNQCSSDMNFVVTGRCAVVCFHIVLRQQNHLIRLDILQLANMLMTVGQLKYNNRTFFTSNPHNLHHSFQYWFGLFFQSAVNILYHIFINFSNCHPFLIVSIYFSLIFSD